MKQTVQPWVWDIVEKHGITEKEAAKMLQWAVDQVHIAAALYAASTLPRPR
jgi:hypothetical protein